MATAIAEADIESGKSGPARIELLGVLSRYVVEAHSTNGRIERGQKVNVSEIEGRWLITSVEK